MKFIRMLACLVLDLTCLFASCFMPTVAFAQDATAAAASIIDPSSCLYVVWTILQPIVTLLVTLFGPVVLAIVVGYLVKLLKITDANQQAALETQLSTALHQSAANAVKFALGKLGMPASSALASDVISLAATYVQDKNPDALAKLGVNATKLQDIITAKAQDIAAKPSA
ncbi:hypothetical protein [Rhizobium mayense]|uniref:Uncharacterized protein n=1 Tax=Rhizobium mayense TaxID=1312184 RepID=A0ABT7K736_9HYPH|nr:hypothetical protein [Rhizobium mayense]MDL2403835.1 hypothetical protein [Rhizobium mayense]